MHSKRPSSERGQALIMVTVALLAMCGLIGMAVDFGWSYFVRREAQAAADAAALAGARAAMDVVRTYGASALTCGASSSSLTCGSETPCATSLSGTWQSACQYAKQNGFTSGGDSGRQQVTIASGVNSPAAPPPTAPNVNVRYWVTVRVSTNIPQLYSAVLGNANATVGARATAAIADYLVNGSVIGLNREGDPAPAGIWQQTTDGANPDLLVGSGGYLSIPANGGIALASKDAGAGTNLGPPFSIVAPYTATRGNLRGGSPWVGFLPPPSIGPMATYTGQADGPQYVDPYRGMGQPPLPTTAFGSTQYYPVEGGNLAAAPACASGTCPPGVYYATSSGIPSGGQITINANLNFSNGAADGWGDYVFYGGLGVTSATVNFGQGRYVLAGITGSTPAALSFGTGAQVAGGTSSDAGTLFIVTNGSYPGLSSIAPFPSAGGVTASSFTFGPTNIDVGSSASVKLYGMNATGGGTLPSDTNPQGYELTDFGPLAIWQDQGYSNFATPSNTSPQMQIGSVFQVDGILYQPRGAWMRVKPNSGLFGFGPGMGAASIGGARLIVGALDVGSNAMIELCSQGCSQGAPLWNRMVALVE